MIGEEGIKPTLKNITIRGVDASVYDEFSKVMKLANLTMGEAITKMMSDVMKDFDEVFPKLSAKSMKLLVKKDKISVRQYRNLSISKKDLVEADKGVSFQHIENLTFEKDVTKEVFTMYVRKIEHCDTVRLSSAIPRLLIYSKISFSKNIEIYEPGEGEP